MFRKGFLATITASSLIAFSSIPAFAFGTQSGTISSCVYMASLPTLTTPGQVSPIPCDANGRPIMAPFSELFSAPLQTYGANGVGADTAFPGSISTSGTSLGALPLGGSEARIHIPIGASVTGYVAASQVANSAAAVAISQTYANTSGSSVLNIDIPLNGMQFWVTNVVTGTSGTYISGLPTFRFL